MRITIVLLLCTVCAPVRAQSGAWANKLLQGKSEHDFGVVPRGANLLHRFSIKNIYAVPLTITNVRVSCGCAEAKPSQTELKPGETASIDVTMDGRRFTGTKAVSIYVTVGPKFVSTAELKVTATNRTDVVLNPGQVSFGVVAPGESSTKVIDVEYAGNLDWRVGEVVTKDAPLRAELKETYRRTAPGGIRQVGYRISVSLTDKAKPQLLSETIVLKTNDPRSPVIPILVEANVQSLLSVSPSSLDLGRVEVGTSLRRRVVVKAEKAFRITKVDGAGEGIQLDGIRPSPDGRAHVLSFLIEPSRAGAIQRELQIRTDAAESPLTIRITGTATARSEGP